MTSERDGTTSLGFRHGGQGPQACIPGFQFVDKATVGVPSGKFQAGSRPVSLRRRASPRPGLVSLSPPQDLGYVIFLPSKTEARVGEFVPDDKAQPVRVTGANAAAQMQARVLWGRTRLWRGGVVAVVRCSGHVQHGLSLRLVLTSWGSARTAAAAY